MKTHSGEKSNKCNQCDYASSRAGHLRTHLKTHSGEKSNKCNQCDYASTRAGHLRTHLKTHSGEKPNKCNQCDYASSHASHLRIHLDRPQSLFDSYLKKFHSQAGLASLYSTVCFQMFPQIACPRGCKVTLIAFV